MTLLKKVGFNTGLQVSGRLIQLAISTATIIILTRYLGPTDYGFYALIIAFVGLFSDISGFGINMVVARQIPVKPKQQATIFANALSLKILASIVLFGLAVIAGLIVYPDAKLHAGLALAALSSFFLSAQTVYQPIFQVKLKIFSFVIADIISRLIGFGFLLFFVYQGLNFNFVIATLVISSFINWLMTDYYARKIFPVRWQVNLSGWKRLVREALPLAGFVILTGVNQKIGLIILSKLKTAEAVGIYQLALQPTIILIGLSALLIGFIYPLFARFLKEDPQRLVRILKSTAESLTLGGLYLSAFIYVTSQHLVSVLGGERFMAASGIFRILALVLLFRLLLLPFQALAIAGRKEKVILISYLIAFLLIIGLSLVLIPDYSYLGAAWALLISDLFLLISILAVSRPYVQKIKWLKMILKSLLPAAVLGLILWFIVEIPIISISQFVDYSIWSRIVIIIGLFLLFSAPPLFQLRGKLKEMLR